MLGSVSRLPRRVARSFARPKSSRTANASRSSRSATAKSSPVRSTPNSAISPGTKERGGERAKNCRRFPPAFPPSHILTPRVQDEYAAKKRRSRPDENSSSLRHNEVDIARLRRSARRLGRRSKASHSVCMYVCEAPWCDEKRMILVRRISSIMTNAS